MSHGLYFLQAMQSISASDCDQIELYISSSIKNSFARVSLVSDCCKFGVL